MLHRFKTVYQHATAEIIEKKSRFIGHAFPVEDEAAALAFLDSVRKEHGRANHNCFAWQFGEQSLHARQSDDGELAGTAGMPILDYLRKEDIKNTLIVVTRYFGGTLLGTGGLVRAYGRAAKEAACAAPVIEKVLYQKYSVVCSYHQSGKLQYEILQRGDICVMLDTLYTDSVEYIVLAEAPHAAAFANFLQDISSGQAAVTPLELVYCADVGGKIVQF